MSKAHNSNPPPGARNVHPPTTGWLLVLVGGLVLAGCGREPAASWASEMNGAADGEALSEEVLLRRGKRLVVEAVGQPVYMSQRNGEWQLTFKDREGKVVGKDEFMAAPEMISPRFHEMKDGQVLYEVESIGWGTGFHARAWSLKLAPVLQTNGMWSAPRQLAGGWIEGYCQYPLPAGPGPHDFYGQSVRDVPEGQGVLVHAVKHRVTVAGNRVQVHRVGNVYLTDWDHAESAPKKYFARRPVNDLLTFNLEDGSVWLEP